MFGNIGWEVFSVTFSEWDNNHWFLICDIKLDAKILVPSASMFRCSPLELRCSLVMFEFTNSDQPLCLANLATTLLTSLILLLRKSYDLTTTEEIVTFVVGDSSWISLPRFTIFSAILLGSSDLTLFVPMWRMILVSVR